MYASLLRRTFLAKNLRRAAVLDALNITLFIKMHINYLYKQYFALSVSIKFYFKILHFSAQVI